MTYVATVNPRRFAGLRAGTSGASTGSTPRQFLLPWVLHAPLLQAPRQALVVPPARRARRASAARGRPRRLPGHPHRAAARRGPRRRRGAGDRRVARRRDEPPERAPRGERHLAQRCLCGRRGQGRRPRGPSLRRHGVDSTGHRPARGSLVGERAARRACVHGRRLGHGAPVPGRQVRTNAHSGARQTDHLRSARARRQRCLRGGRGERARRLHLAFRRHVFQGRAPPGRSPEDRQGRVAGALQGVGRGRRRLGRRRRGHGAP